MSADIIVRADPASGAFGLQPRTPRGESWLSAFAVPIGGFWRQGSDGRCFWMFADEFPREILRDSSLVVVLGEQQRGEGERPADAWLGR